MEGGSCWCVSMEAGKEEPGEEEKQMLVMLINVDEART